jgi:hypothetical protein
MDDDLIIVNELVLMTFNIRKEVCERRFVVRWIILSLSFLTKYENKKTHNMVFLMLDF